MLPDKGRQAWQRQRRSRGDGVGEDGTGHGRLPVAASQVTGLAVAACLRRMRVYADIDHRNGELVLSAAELTR